METKNKTVGGDGLVDGETTYGEDIKGASTFNDDVDAGPVDDAETSTTPDTQATK